MIIGGSDSYHSLALCELYSPSKDSFYTFPSLNAARENSSACVVDRLKKNGEIYIYVFGGFDKKAIGSIERIRIDFDPDL